MSYFHIIALLNDDYLYRIIGLPCHVGSADDREKLIEETVGQLGGIDILVSNAATNPTMGPMLDVIT
jgi:NAD(P)-dependent dehydrogenase (short-subunit alcohol dehydrogenase family)